MKTLLNAVDTVFHFLSLTLQFLFLCFFSIIFFHLSYIVGVIVSSYKEGYTRGKQVTKDTLNDI